MKRVMTAEGVYVYEAEEEDLQAEAVRKLACLQAQSLSDEAAVAFSALFPRWTAGAWYEAGTRLASESGALYRVVQAHMAQADWPMEQTRALYTPLGLTEEDPDAIAMWVQPTGAHDAYAKGALVSYQGKVYESNIDANIYAPDTEFWTEQ